MAVVVNTRSQKIRVRNRFTMLGLRCVRYLTRTELDRHCLAGNVAFAKLSSPKLTSDRKRRWQTGILKRKPNLSLRNKLILPHRLVNSKALLRAWLRPRSIDSKSAIGELMSWTS